ncbi:MAG: HAD hydrolase-like protein [Gemmatimonadetes bacterium]|nr:HAD hydrolase-like protein [Gemmatimonadota bacterium]
MVQGYDTQAGFAVRVRLGGRDHWAVDGVAVGRAPDGPCIPVRKPSGRLVRGAIGWAAKNTGAVGEAIVVGDQYLTDIASANLAGVRSVKVRNLWPRSFPLSVRIGQRIEGVLYRLRFGRPVKGWS